ncbi:MAG: hypothetical protein OJF47_003914 [Nitrospira sp.]|jgi:hypothetical protein|nr:MAG: hypothetical protein OJF47_003914 [Nitrospira sp.]
MVASCPVCRCEKVHTNGLSPNFECGRRLLGVERGDGKKAHLKALKYFGDILLEVRYDDPHSIGARNIDILRFEVRAIPPHT